MSTKNTSPVLANCADDEPIFVLRAQDIHAPATLRWWLYFNEGFISQEKQFEVESIIEAMEQWPNRKQPD